MTDTTDTARGILDTLAELHLIELGAGCTARPGELRPDPPDRHPETQARHDHLRERLATLADTLYTYAVAGNSIRPAAATVARLVVDNTGEREPVVYSVGHVGPRAGEVIGPLIPELPADPPYRLDTFRPGPFPHTVAALEREYLHDGTARTIEGSYAARERRGELKAQRDEQGDGEADPHRGYVPSSTGHPD